MKPLNLGCSLIAALALSNAAHAQAIVPVNISGTGDYYNALGKGAAVLIDGVTAPEQTNWQDPTPAYFNGLNTDNTAGSSGSTLAGGTTVWWKYYGTNGANNVQFTIDLGNLFNVTRIDWSVDNNDGYQLAYSLDGLSFTKLLDISQNSGNIYWGMDTLSSLAGSPNYDQAMAFTPFTARYLRVGTGTDIGDGLLAFSEVQAYGTAASEAPVTAVPEPSTYGLLGAAALAGVAAFRRNRRKS